MAHSFATLETKFHVIILVVSLMYIKLGQAIHQLLSVVIVSYIHFVISILSNLSSISIG